MEQTGWKVEGESPDGRYLDGNIFDTIEEAENEQQKLLMEFPNNEYWVECWYRVMS